MTFLDQRLHDGVARGSRGGPVGSRTKAYLPNGQLQQQFNYSRALHRYDISFGIKTADDFEAIRTLFYVVMFTPYEGFRMRDWNDYTASPSNSTLTLVSGTTWQLQRVYTNGSVSFKRDIVKPESGSVTVYRTRSGVTTTIAPTIDATTGRVTISGHVSGDTYTWAGRFDVPVTFEDDNALASIELDGIEASLLQGLPSILLEEIRL